MATMYQIRLRGHLDRRHKDWLEDFTMTLHPDGETILTGYIADQAALHGILLRIRDFGIPLLSVNEIDPETAESETSLNDSGEQKEEGT